MLSLLDEVFQMDDCKGLKRLVNQTMICLASDLQTADAVLLLQAYLKWGEQSAIPANKKNRLE